MDHGRAKHQRAGKAPPRRHASHERGTSATPNVTAPTAIQALPPPSKRPAPPPPSSRRNDQRELPAPTPLVLPTRLHAAARMDLPNLRATSPGNPAKVATLNSPTVGLKANVPPDGLRRSDVERGRGVTSGQPPRTAPSRKAPPPPSSRKATSKERGQSVQEGTASVPTARRSSREHDAAQQVDGEWAAHLASPKPGRELEGAAARAQTAGREEPPTLPHNLPLLNLEGEISALRPRPSEIPPEPIAASPGPEPRVYRGKTPSDLSLLYQALPSNFGETSEDARHAARSRGFVPRAPHEYLPPPPPPSKRVSAAKSRDLDDDEAPTQARRPAIFVEPSSPSRAQQSPTPPPAWSPAAMASHLGSRSPLPPPSVQAKPTRLPAPPLLPTDVTPPSAWPAEDWTDTRYVEALSPNPPVSPRVDPRLAPAAPLVTPAPESLLPTALSIPPRSGRVTSRFGVPVGWVPVAGASLLGAALAAGAFLLPERGQLLVDVTNQSFAALPGARVYLDGELVCSRSPCALKVSTTTHRVRVEAPGYQPSGDESVVVSEDVVTLHKVQLGASSDTGIEVETTIPNLQLYVDGRRVGSLPRKVMGLAPGEHTVTVTGGDNFTTEERRIQLEPNQTLNIRDLQPRLKSGTLELIAGQNAKGARVTIDGNEVTLPYRGQLEPGRVYRVLAQRDGYQPVTRDVTFDASTPTLKVPVDFDEAAATAADTLGQPMWSARPRWQEAAASTPEARAPESRSDESAKDESTSQPQSQSADTELGAAMRQSVGLPSRAPTETRPAAAGGQLNIVTTPSAVVLLDGKPVGKTPTRVTVSAGVHSVVLIHGNERKRASINVDPGANKTIKATF